MPQPSDRAKIVIATPLKTDHVERIRAACPSAEVAYDPTLLPAPRYPCDHRGDPAFRRNAAAERRWSEFLAEAEIALGIPGESPEGLRDLIARAPKLRWVQSMFAGGGETVRAAALPRATLERIPVATTAGIHGSMLAEFAFYGMLALRKEAVRLAETRARRSFARFPLGELFGAVLAVVGTGQIGTSVARLGRAFGMRTIGVARDAAARDGFDEVVPLARLREACARCDALVLALPGTPATHHVVGARELAALSPDAIVVNVGRGTTIDQAALSDALLGGRIRGAVLDVFDPEPLPPEHPFWTLENVVMAPHTATLSVRENARIVELFIENLGRDARGEALRNRVDIDEFY